MLYSPTHWPYNWFGLWREYGPDYEDYPSIHEFIDHAANQAYDHAPLLAYLNGGVPAWATGRGNYPDPFTGATEPGSILFRTDGEWTWLENISDLVQHRGLVLPDAFYRHMRATNFTIPDLDDDALERAPHANMYGPGTRY